MGALEICLLVIGAIIVAVSFIFSEQLVKDDGQEKFFSGDKFSEVAQEIIRKEVEKELSLMVDDTMDEAKKELNRVSAEKILAMGEYSEDINLRITKNHEEVMFLYNMLNDKESVIKNTMSDIEALKTSVKKMNKGETAHSEEVVKSSVSASEAGGDVLMNVAKKPEIKADSKEDSKKRPDASKKSNIGDKKANNNKIILDLYNHGMNNVDIAKQLGLGVGEVNLVIDLFNSKKND